MLRRHDYHVNIAGGFGAAQLTSDYAVASGIRLPTKRRAYTRGPDHRPIAGNADGLHRHEQCELRIRIGIHAAVA